MRTIFNWFCIIVVGISDVVMKPSQQDFTRAALLFQVVSTKRAAEGRRDPPVKRKQRFSSHLEPHPLVAA